MTQKVWDNSYLGIQDITSTILVDNFTEETKLFN